MNNTSNVENVHAAAIDTHVKNSPSVAPLEVSSQRHEAAKAESQSGNTLPTPTPATATEITVSVPVASITTDQKVEQAVQELNDYAQSMQRDLHFSLDEELGRSIIHVVDRKTQEIIRQIPNETALQLARNLNDRVLESQQLEMEGLEAQSSPSLRNGSLGLINIRI